MIHTYVMDESEIASSVTRSLLPLAALITLEEEPLHGYALMGELRNLGFDNLKSGTLYPLLRKLQDDDLIDAEWVLSESGPAKKSFCVTESGKAAVGQINATLLEQLVKLRIMKNEENQS